jgi:hypothetical protein
MRIITSCILQSFFVAIVVSQTQTTGGISGTVTDRNGDVLINAAVTATSHATGEKRLIVTDSSGRFTVSLIRPGRYEVRVEAAGFQRADIDVEVTLADSSEISIVLNVADVVPNLVTVEVGTPMVRTDSSTIGQTIGGRALENLPLPTRNFSQLINLVPGASTYLTDATSLGRNSNVISVDGIRPAQNNFQINGVDANAGVMRNVQFGNPAPESIAEVKVQTSNYDATFGRAGGGSVQIVTRSGTNNLDGSLYYYFSDTSFNANDPFLKAAGRPRPVLVRNVYGGTLGGPIGRERAFFFVSYQGSRERNGFSRASSLRTNIVVDSRLTDDRSPTGLAASFPGIMIHPVARNLLVAQLPDGRYVIPTPQANGRYSTSEISRFREDQFNANVDLKVSKSNWLAIKFFSADSPQFLAFSGNSAPGFGEDQDRYYRIVSVQDVHNFDANVINEARIGYNFIRENGRAKQPIDPVAIGIERSNSAEYPGLPSINIGPLSIGPGFRQDRIASPSTSFTDTVSITRGRHGIRLGGDARYYQFYGEITGANRGVIVSQNFNSFLAGTVALATLANGFSDRNLRSFDYHFFIQDDWRISRKVTLNLGLRYEVDVPLYDTRGRIATFDPLRYQPRMELGPDGYPLGPPIGGIVQSRNAIPQYDLPGIPKVKSHALYGTDINNFAPRVGIAYSPLKSDRLVLRAAYGIFYSRSSFQYLSLAAFSPPFGVVNTSRSTALDDPFPLVPAASAFPIFPEGELLSGVNFDPGLRTPYSHQFNGSLQLALGKDIVIEASYVGTRGLNLFRQELINQAYLATPDIPIHNVVTGLNIGANTPANAQLRAPLQGVRVDVGFTQNQTTAQSTYHAAQLSLNHRFSRGLQLLTSYTFSKSIDNGSGIGGGSGTTPDHINDTATSDGDHRDSRSNRGLSSFDRTHRLVVSYVWELPLSRVGTRSKGFRSVMSDWQLSGILTAMSGLPINIRDSRAAELFFGQQGGGDRPSWVAGASPATAMTNIPLGYYFDPRSFRRPVLAAGQVIPSSLGVAFAGPGCPVIDGAFCTDFGNVGRNPLRGPSQFSLDVSLRRRFRINESKDLELRVEAFNIANTVNFANPISDFNATINDGSINQASGLITSPGNFGRITATSSNPRIMQLAIKFNF